MKILAIDTSCDDTSVAISEDRKIIANVFWSKLKVHNDWGGVVPTEAKRQHEEFLPLAITAALEEAKLQLEDIDYFAVTYGPGLAIALEPGIDKAVELAKMYNKPLVPVNHMVGHIYANLAQDANRESYSSIKEFDLPSLALTISGGHTDLFLFEKNLKFKKIGHTLDDAIGEAFDKVGRLLGLGFPAGFKIEQLALNGNPDRFKFPRPLHNTNDFNWSYSGLKTAVLYEVNKLLGTYQKDIQKGEIKFGHSTSALSEQDINDIAASFQKAAIDALLIKVEKAVKQYAPKMLIVGGGVIANQALRTAMEALCEKYKLKLTYPKPMWLCTDNAAMIAATAYFLIKEGQVISEQSKFESVERVPNLEIS